MAGSRTGDGLVRTLVIGDIHGCYDELQDLLDAAAITEDDQIIALGDLVNRGPNAFRVWDFFARNVSPNVHSIMGNHEHKHLRAHHGRYQPTLSMLLTRWQLNRHYPQAIRYMRCLPLYLDLPEALLVHAYYEPGVALEDQQDRILIGTMGATKYLQQTYDCPWYTYYEGDKPLIVGHKDISGCQEPFVYEDRVYGIDTGCVYGGQLTGLLLPEFRIVSVPARETHWQNTLQQYESNS